MEFKYRYRMTPMDLWQIYMYNAYASYMAVVNIICIVSSIILIIALWGNAGWGFRIVMLLFLSLFTVIQPLVMYKRATKALEGNQEEMELTFHEKGLTVVLGDKQESKDWNQIMRVVVKPTVLIVYMDAAHGYILSNRVLGNNRKEFISFLKAKRASNKKK